MLCATLFLFVGHRLLVIALIAFGFLARPEWEMSKIRATPSWTTISTGISVICFLILIFIADVKKYVRWAKPIYTGGAATLTCYFALYFVYSLMHILNLYWPAVLTTGALGILKSLCFAYIVIQLTAWAGKLRIRLNI